MLNRLTVLLATTLLCSSGLAQDQAAVRGELFGATDALKAQADTQNAALLAPGAYAEAMKLYGGAGDTLVKGRNLDRVRRDLGQANAYFNRAIDGAKLARVTFAATLTARSAADRAEAPRYAERDWRRAENGLEGAARRLESGDLRSANKDTARVQEIYKQAEMKALAAKAKTSAR